MKINKIVDGYLAVKNPYSPKLLRTGAVLASLSRIMNHYRIKATDSRSTAVYCNFYFLYFGSSGIGKDMARDAFNNMDAFKAFLAEEVAECLICEKKSIERLKEQYLRLFSDNEIEQGSKEWRDEQKKALNYARGKLRKIQPEMNESTRPNLEVVGLEVCRYDKIGLTLTNGEFLMWMKYKRSEAFEMFSFLAEVYDKGRVNLKGTMANNRGADESVIEGLPMNVVFMSSEALMGDGAISGNLKDFFLTAGARRFFTASEKELETALFSEHEIERDFQSYSNETEILISRFIKSCAGNVGKKLTINKEVLVRMKEVKMEMKAKVLRQSDLSEIIKICLMGYSWRALKLAGILAVFNHGDDYNIYLSDYEEALELTGMFTNSFKNIVDRNWTEDDDVFMKYVLDNPGCGKGSLYSLPIFAKNNRTRRIQYDDFMEGCMEKLKNEGKTLYTEKGANGLSECHFIKDIPKNLENDNELLFNISFSKDMANGFKFDSFSLERLMKLMESDGYNYASGSFEGGHRSQKDWKGRNNSLILDIDNETTNLTIKEFKNIFGSFSFIIQPTKSHNKDKSGHGVKERYRVIFPTAEMPKMDVKRFRNIYDNFHKVFGISEAGDIKAAGDSARFYYPSPHKTEFHKGEFMVNWEMYDYSKEEKPSIPFNKEFKGDKKNVNPSLSSFFNSYSSLAIGEKKSAKCPQHEDKNASAFVKRHTNGNLFCSCSSGCELIWDK